MLYTLPGLNPVALLTSVLYTRQTKVWGSTKSHVQRGCLFKALNNAFPLNSTAYLL